MASNLPDKHYLVANVLLDCNLLWEVGGSLYVHPLGLQHATVHPSSPRMTCQQSHTQLQKRYGQPLTSDQQAGWPVGHMCARHTNPLQPWHHLRLGT